MKTHTINSAISIAFANAVSRLIEEGKDHPLVDKVMSSLDRKQNEIKRNDWNANLSFKTYNILKNQGVLV